MTPIASITYSIPMGPTTISISHDLKKQLLKVAADIQGRTTSTSPMQRKLYVKAAEIKWERALALGDCYTIANAKATNSAALFAFREEELKREMERKPFDVQIKFIEDLPREGSL
jgi:hypothetical protein